LLIKKKQLKKLNITSLQKWFIRLKDIIKELEKPGLDPRKSAKA
jgi:transcriptional accessory protein Tex/SPT6